MRSIVVVLVASCGGTAPTEPAAPEQQHADEDVVVPPPPDAQQRLEEDLDGDGFAETITLSRANVLRIEGHEIRLSPDAAASIQVIDVDTTDGVREVLVTTTAGVEDPPNVFLLFGFRHDEVELLLEVTSTESLGVGGDGTVRVLDLDWTACGRVGGPQLVRSVQIVFAPDQPGERLAPVGRTFTGRDFPCDAWAACPFVYAVDDDGAATQVGEILRYVRGAAAYTWQSLALPDAALVRISEEKDEVTYLDELFLDVAGRHVAPAACGSHDPPAYCVADDRFHVLRRGESLELDFGGARGDLVAGGYYIPRPR